MLPNLRSGLIRKCPSFYILRSVCRCPRAGWPATCSATCKNICGLGCWMTISGPSKLSLGLRTLLYMWQHLLILPYLRPWLCEHKLKCDNFHKVTVLRCRHKPQIIASVQTGVRMPPHSSWAVPTVQLLGDQGLFLVSGLPIITVPANVFVQMTLHAPPVG